MAEVCRVLNQSSTQRWCRYGGPSRPSASSRRGNVRTCWIVRSCPALGGILQGLTYHKVHRGHTGGSQCAGRLQSQLLRQGADLRLITRSKYPHPSNGKKEVLVSFAPRDRRRKDDAGTLCELLWPEFPFHFCSQQKELGRPEIHSFPSRFEFSLSPISSFIVSPNLRSCVWFVLFRLSFPKIWDLKKGNNRVTLRGHRGPVSCLSFFDKDGCVAAGDKSGRVLLHKLDAPPEEEVPRLFFALQRWTTQSLSISHFLSSVSDSKYNARAAWNIKNVVPRHVNVAPPVQGCLLDGCK